MNIKRIIKILIFNLITTLIIVEAITYTYELYIYAKDDLRNENKKIQNKIEYIIKNMIKSCKTTRSYHWLTNNTYEEIYEYIRNNLLRKPIGLEYKTNPIVLFGCSFAYGYNLSDTENFSGQLSKLLKRPVYNRAYNMWWGPQNMLFQLRRKDFYEEIKGTPDLVIYVLIFDHYFRAATSNYSTYTTIPHLHYKFNKKGELVEDKKYFIYNLFTIRKIACLIGKNKDIKESQKILNKILIESKKETDRHWNNPKFILLVYEDDIDSLNNFQNINFQELKDAGFIVISASSLLDSGDSLYKKEYKIFDNMHPSEKLWSVLTPKLIQKLNIK